MSENIPVSRELVIDALKAGYRMRLRGCHIIVDPNTRVVEIIGDKPHYKIRKRLQENPK